MTREPVSNRRSYEVHTMRRKQCYHILTIYTVSGQASEPETYYFFVIKAVGHAGETSEASFYIDTSKAL